MTITVLVIQKLAYSKSVYSLETGHVPCYSCDILLLNRTKYRIGLQKDFQKFSLVVYAFMETFFFFFNLSYSP